MKGAYPGVLNVIPKDQEFWLGAQRDSGNGKSWAGIQPQVQRRGGCIGSEGRHRGEDASELAVAGYNPHQNARHPKSQPR